MQPLNVFGTHSVIVSRHSRTPQGVSEAATMTTISGVFFAPSRRLVRLSNGEQATAAGELIVPPEYVDVFTTDGLTRVTYEGREYTVFSVEYTKPPAPFFPDQARVTVG